MTIYTPFRDLLHAANLRHGTDGFTSPPKEGVLRIFSPWKILTASAVFEPTNLGKKGTLRVNQALQLRQVGSTCGMRHKQQMAHQSDTTEGTSWCAMVTWELPAMTFVVWFGFCRRNVLPASKFTVCSLKTNSNGALRLLHVTKWRTEL